MVITVQDGADIIAVIVKASFNKEGVSFFSPDSFSQQLAYMRHPAGKHISAHVHNPVPREVTFTQEVLVVKSGKVRADLYRQDQTYLESHVLSAGDVILLASGGHGFQVLEELEMIEVKQGPYAGPNEKTRFDSIPEDSLVLRS